MCSQSPHATCIRYIPVFRGASISAYTGHAQLFFAMGSQSPARNLHIVCTCILRSRHISIHSSCTVVLCNGSTGEGVHQQCYKVWYRNRFGKITYCQTYMLVQKLFFLHQPKQPSTVSVSTDAGTHSQCHISMAPQSIWQPVLQLQKRWLDLRHTQEWRLVLQQVCHCGRAH